MKPEFLDQMPKFASKTDELLTVQAAKVSNIEYYGNPDEVKLHTEFGDHPLATLPGVTFEEGGYLVQDEDAEGPRYVSAADFDEQYAAIDPETV